MPDNNVCSDFTQGVRAYNNIDLISNGFIDVVGQKRTLTRRLINGQAQLVEDFIPIRLLPSGRISIELQYSVRSDISGTSLNSISPGGNAGFIFGGLGGGAGFGIASAIGCSLLGDFEPTKSKFVFHVCESETFINREIIVTQEMLDSDGIISLPNYVVAVLGVTSDILDFTEEQIASIGSGNDNTRGAKISTNGQVKKSFDGVFQYDDPSQNRFENIVFEARSIYYRADNATGENCFENRSQDDITTKRIKIRVKEITTDPHPVNDIKAGDKVYITYVGCSSRIIRHAIFASSSFFLFPNFLVERIGVDQVRGWNFRPKKYNVRKNMLSDPTTVSRANLLDLDHDAALIEEINEIQLDKSLDDKTRKERIQKIQNELVLEQIEGQRLVECINDSKTNKPYIRGFYFADTRGILLQKNDATSGPEIIVSRESIRDQKWFDSFIGNFVDGGPGFDAQGHLDFRDDGSSRLIKGFYFDVSDHNNLGCLDNEKYGYQTDLALALLDVSKFSVEDITSGIGIPNLDLEVNSVLGRDKYDLSSVRFELYKMSSTEGGSYFIRDCNKIFTYDQQFCSSGTVQSDMFIRTPFFFDKFSETSRVYVERFSPQFGINPDGGIWVATSIVADDNISASSHPYNDIAGVVFNDFKSSTLNYNLMVDFETRFQASATSEDITNASLNHENIDVSQITSSDSLLYLGYDRVFGNVPSYTRGKEITTDQPQILLGLLNKSSTYISEKASFQHSDDSDTISVSGINNRRMVSIKIRYEPKASFISLDKRNLSVIFPNNNWTIDNIYLNYYGKYSSKPEIIAQIDGGYYYDENIRIIGEALKHVKITGIDIMYITDDAYNKSKIETNIIGSSFDSRGAWYVVYEDRNAKYGFPPLSKSYTDGAVLTEDETVEISCLVSYDLGKTWFDHKAIVRSISGDEISSPYIINDTKSNIMHLFYVLNGNLMHKSIDANLFTASDAFKSYKRPSKFDDSTDDNIGIEHFTENGQKIRQSPSDVVAGEIRDNNNDYFVINNQISKKRKENNKSYRLEYSDVSKYKKPFGVSDFTSYIDSKGSIKVFYALNGKMYCRAKSGQSDWIDIFSEDGTFFHRISVNQEPRDVSRIGVVYSETQNIVYISYIADDMIFVRGIDSKLLEKDSIDEGLLNGASKSYESIFIVGQMLSDLSSSITSGSSRITFPYPISVLSSFNEKMSINNVASRGYVGSTGLIRFFYKDFNSNVRAFSLQHLKPKLDAKFVLRS